MPSNSNSNSRETMSAHTSLNRRMASRSLLSAHFALRGDDVINQRVSLQPLGGGGRYLVEVKPVTSAAEKGLPWREVVYLRIYPSPERRIATPNCQRRGTVVGK